MMTLDRHSRSTVLIRGLCYCLSGPFNLLGALPGDGCSHALDPTGLFHLVSSIFHSPLYMSHPRLFWNLILVHKM